MCSPVVNMQVYVQYLTSIPRRKLLEYSVYSALQVKYLCMSGNGKARGWVQGEKQVMLLEPPLPCPRERNHYRYFLTLDATTPSRRTKTRICM